MTALLGARLTRFSVPKDRLATPKCYSARSGFSRDHKKTAAPQACGTAVIRSVARSD